MVPPRCTRDGRVASTVYARVATAVKARPSILASGTGTVVRSTTTATPWPRIVRGIMSAVGRHGRTRRTAAILVVAAVVTAAMALGAAPSGAANVEAPKGAGPPTPGSGIGTKAAMDRADCNKGNERLYSVYGRLD